MPPSKPFNGIMIIGEAPGREEVVRDAPFQGRSGELLDAMLSAAGIEREATWITNTLLGYPPKKPQGAKGSTLHAWFPNAIYSCLPRLEAEIEAARPKVIVLMGPAPLTAATGTVIEKNQHVDNPCDYCDPKTRKIGPAVQCAKGCGWTWLDALGQTEERAKELWAEAKEALGGTCPRCEANIKNLRIGDRKCPKCGGKKKKVREVAIFKDGGYALTGKNGMAGALFASDSLPSAWNELGVEYVIATLHPKYCLYSQGVERGFGGQFAALAVVDHLEKARRLVERPPRYEMSVLVTDRAEDVEAFTREPGVYDCDIETDALSPWDVSELRCIGISVPGREQVLVVDTRRMLQVRRSEDALGVAYFDIEVLDAPLFEALSAFLTEPSKGKNWTNGSYDCVVLWRMMGLRVRPLAADTKIAHHCLRPDEPHKLSHIAAAMTEALYWKQPKKMAGQEQWESFEQFAIYNAHDCRTQGLAIERMVGSYRDGERG